jgi:mono/diheme cytochrome c family protein
MKRTLLAVVVVSVFAALLGAQDDAAYKTAMKAVNASAGGRMAPLTAAITNKDVAAAAAEAKKVEDGFATILAYWQAKKADDAIQLATTAHDAAKTIAESKDADAQAAAAMQLRRTCNQCHMAHRGGMPPDFEIK